MALRPMPAMRFGVLIAAMQPVSISLPVFRSQRRASAFWSRNPFPLLPRIYAECARHDWGKAIFCPTITALPSDSCKQRKRLDIQPLDFQIASAMYMGKINLDGIGV